MSDGIGQEEEDLKHLHIGLPLDPSGYLRHECPGCAMEFKLQGDECRFTDSLDWWVSKALAESGIEGRDEYAQGTPGRAIFCPYCDAAAPPQEFLHSEFRAYVRRVALREIAEPLLFNALREMERTLSRGSRGGDMFSISIKVERGSRNRSPRPIAGPDADDMVRIGCLACGEHFKALEGWVGPIRCPACSASLKLV